MIISLSLSLCARAQAIIIRDEISEITCGKIEFFPDKLELEEAREDICAVIHAKSPFQPKTSKGDGVEKKEKHDNPYKSMDAEQMTKAMMAKVESIYAYLDEKYPRSTGERSRSEVWQDNVRAFLA